MSRFQWLLARVVGIALVLGLSVPAARAQRCPFQMQMWYHVQMQQWAYQQRLSQAQRLQPTPLAQNGAQFQPRTFQPSAWRGSLSLQPQMSFGHTVHSSLALHMQTLLGHGGSGGIGFHPLGMHAQLTTTTSTHATLHLQMTAHLHRLTPERLAEPTSLTFRRTALQPNESLRSRTVQLAGARPLVTGGVRFTCASGCHGQQDSSTPFRMPLAQQPADLLPVRFLQMQRPPQPPLRGAPPPDLFLVNLLQRLRQPPAPLPLRAALPAAQVLQADVPPWLRGFEQPPLAGMLLRPPLQPGVQRGRQPGPGESLWVPDSTTSEPSGLTRVLDEPPPLSTELMARLPAEEPIRAAAPEAAGTTPESPASLEALLEAPPPPPTLDALLPPPPAEGPAAEESVVRVASASDLGSLLEAPPPGRVEP